MKRNKRPRPLADEKFKPITVLDIIGPMGHGMAEALEAALAAEAKRLGYIVKKKK